MIYRFEDKDGVVFFVNIDEIIIAISHPNDNGIYALFKNGQERDLNESLGEFVLSELNRTSIRVENNEPERTASTDFNVQQVRAIELLEREREHCEEGNAHA